MLSVVIAAVVAVYSYPIGLSFWAVRVQRAASLAPHHPHDHRAADHAAETFLHIYVAVVLAVSLSLRLVQLTTGLTAWVLVPATVVVAWWTWGRLIEIWRMALEDLRFVRLRLSNKLKTVLLLACATVLLADQVWRVVTLFWAGRPAPW